MGAPCGPETLIWLGKSNIEGSKMEFPPTAGVCFVISLSWGSGDFTAFWGCG